MRGKPFVFFLLFALCASGCQSVSNSSVHQPAVDALLNLAEAHIDAGRPQAAKPMIDEAERLNPSNSRVQALRAQWFLFHGDRAAAVQIYEGLWKKDVAAALAYGRLLVQLDNPKAATKALEVLVGPTQAPGFEGRAEAWMLKGRAYRSLGEVALAAETISRAVNSDGFEPLWVVELLTVHLMQGDYTSAHRLVDHWRIRAPESVAVEQMLSAWNDFVERTHQINPRFGT